MPEVGSSELTQVLRMLAFNSRADQAAAEAELLKWPIATLLCPVLGKYFFQVCVSLDPGSRRALWPFVAEIALSRRARPIEIERALVIVDSIVREITADALECVGLDQPAKNIRELASVSDQESLVPALSAAHAAGDSAYSSLISSPLGASVQNQRAVLELTLIASQAIGVANDWLEEADAQKGVTEHSFPLESILLSIDLAEAELPALIGAERALQLRERLLRRLINCG